MIGIKVNPNFKAVYSEMKKIKKQSRYATAVALTRTAKDVQKAVVEQMKKDFDNPTPFTLAGTYAKTAKINDLDASVKLKDFIPKGTPAAKYLNPNIYSGDRNSKRSERQLRSKGKLGSTMYIVPGQALRKDRYGNITKGNMTKILSSVSGFDEVGYNMNSAKKTPMFVIAKQNGKLSPGIWQRNGRRVKPIIMFVRKPHYKKRYKFFEVGNLVRDKVFRSHWDKEFLNAMRSAR